MLLGRVCAEGIAPSVAPFLPGMSTPPAPSIPTEPRPSPWLTWAASVALPLLALAVQWGVLGADLRNLERRSTTTETELARVAAAQGMAATQNARIETRLDGMERELNRLARAVERLTQSPATARDVP